MMRAAGSVRDSDKQGAGVGGAGYGEGGGAPGEAHPPAGADRIARAALTQDIAYGAGGGSG